MAEDLAGSVSFANCGLETASVENKVKLVCSAEESVKLSFYQFLIQWWWWGVSDNGLLLSPVPLCKGNFKMKV